MHDRDCLHRFVFEHYPIRGHLVHLDAAWRALIEHRAYPDAIRGLLGEAVAASLLLAATIKFDGVLSLQLQGDGPVHLLLAQCTSGLGVRGLAALISLVEAGSINGPTAKQLLEELYLRGGDPGAVVRERGLAQVSDTEEIGRIVSSVIEANAAAAADFRGGKEQALHSLVGQVMKATRGRADARLVNRLLRERLSG